jgi:hypothetical protein
VTKDDAALVVAVPLAMLSHRVGRYVGTGKHRHVPCQIAWRLKPPTGDIWELTAEKHARCKRCGWVDRSVCFDLPEKEES